MRSRQKILDATVRLIEESGFAAVNVAAVATAAGVSRQTVYSIFGSREEIVSQALVGLAVDVIGNSAAGRAGLRPSAIAQLRAETLSRSSRKRPPGPGLLSYGGGCAQVSELSLRVWPGSTSCPHVGACVEPAALTLKSIVSDVIHH